MIKLIVKKVSLLFIKYIKALSKKKPPEIYFWGFLICLVYVFRASWLGNRIAFSFTSWEIIDLLIFSWNYSSPFNNDYCDIQYLIILLKKNATYLSSKNKYSTSNRCWRCHDLSRPNNYFWSSAFQGWIYWSWYIFVMNTLIFFYPLFVF